jgi:hypothetical protein
MPTLHESLTKHFRDNRNDWIPSAVIQRMLWRDSNGYIATAANITRRLRELEEMKRIAVKYEGAKRHALYKYLPSNLAPNYRTTSEREREGFGNYSNAMWRKELGSFRATAEPDYELMDQRMQAA